MYARKNLLNNSLKDRVEYVKQHTPTYKEHAYFTTPPEEAPRNSPLPIHFGASSGQSHKKKLGTMLERPISLPNRAAKPKYQTGIRYFR